MELAPFDPTSEAAILSRVVDPDSADLPPDAARAILKLKFGGDDVRRMHELVQKARDGTLTGSEQAELESFRRVGHFLELLWSKARVSLKERGDAPAPFGNG